MQAMEKIKTTIKRIPVKDLELLEVNARFMRHEQFQQLVKNVKRDGGLTSIPFGVLSRETGRYKIISGNHRTMAAKQAGLEEIDVMVTDDNLSRDQILGIQISHNAINGEDDPATLKMLYEEIEGLDYKEYAGLDDKTLKLLEEVQADSTPFQVLEWSHLTMSFLPEELEAIKEAFAKAEAVAKGEHWVVPMREYERFQDALSMIGDSHGIGNKATALNLILSVFYRHLDELQEGYLEPGGDAPSAAAVKQKRWVPIASVFGSTEIPVEVAHVVIKALEKAVSSSDVTKETRWRFLEIAAANYLAEA